MPLFQARPHLSYSIKALKSEQEDHQLCSATHFLCFFTHHNLSDCLLYSFTFNMISMHSKPFLNSSFLNISHQLFIIELLSKYWSPKHKKKIILINNHSYSRFTTLLSTKKIVLIKHAAMT